jgi:hypothetical protein
MASEAPKNARMSAAPWKSVASAPRKAPDEHGLQPLWLHFLSTAEFFRPPRAYEIAST